MDDPKIPSGIIIDEQGKRNAMPAPVMWQYLAALPDEKKVKTLDDDGNEFEIGAGQLRRHIEPFAIPPKTPQQNAPPLLSPQAPLQGPGPSNTDLAGKGFDQWYRNPGTVGSIVTDPLGVQSALRSPKAAGAGLATNAIMQLIMRMVAPEASVPISILKQLVAGGASGAAQEYVDSSDKDRQFDWRSPLVSGLAQAPMGALSSMAGRTAAADRSLQVKRAPALAGGKSYQLLSDALKKSDLGSLYDTKSSMESELPKISSAMGTTVTGTPTVPAQRAAILGGLLKGGTQRPGTITPEGAGRLLDAEFKNSGQLASLLKSTPEDTQRLIDSFRAIEQADQAAKELSSKAAGNSPGTSLLHRGADLVPGKIGLALRLLSPLGGNSPSSPEQQIPASLLNILKTPGTTAYGIVNGLSKSRGIPEAMYNEALRMAYNESQKK